jgi:tRNA nucleotidyltransferase (CCA-adding enzyme)
MVTTLKTVLKRIKPSEKEEKEMRDFVRKIVETTKKISKKVKPMVCGSVAKNTWLSKKNELDLFILFDPGVSKKELEKEGLEIAKKIVKKLNGRYQIAYAEHPYLRGWIGKYQVDIVPCYDVKNPEKIKSSVDRTPHHVRYVKKNLKTPDEVRLLKQFCIANGCYGADTKTLGFSGYLCELLIIKYGSFMNCIRNASRWRAGHIITFNEIRKEDIYEKFRSPLIVIDPVDRNRNVSAVVSPENFYKFVKICKDFLLNPKEEFFFPGKERPLPTEKILRIIKNRGTEWYAIRFKKPNIIEDILYPQLRRCLKAFTKIFEQNGFKVLRSDFFCNEDCFLIFEMEIWQVPKIMKHIGPNIYSKHAEEFLKHYKNEKVYIEKENWVVEKEREFTNALKLLKILVKKSNKILLEKGIPSKIAPCMRNCKIYDLSNLRKILKKSKELRIFLKKWFEKDLNVV